MAAFTWSNVYTRCFPVLDIITGVCTAAMLFQGTQCATCSYLDDKRVGGRLNDNSLLGSLFEPEQSHMPVVMLIFKNCLQRLCMLEDFLSELDGTLSRLASEHARVGNTA